MFKTGASNLDQGKLPPVMCDQEARESLSRFSESSEGKFLLSHKNHSDCNFFGTAGCLAAAEGGFLKKRLHPTLLYHFFGGESSRRES